MSKPHLIDTPSPWRLWSMWAAAALLLLSMLQADVLPFVQPLVQPEYWPWVSGGFALTIALLRLVKQQIPGRDDDVEES